VPFEPRYAAPVDPEMVAVGLPEATLMKPNLADAVVTPPTKRSSVVFTGTNAPREE